MYLTDGVNVSNSSWNKARIAIKNIKTKTKQKVKKLKETEPGSNLTRVELDSCNE